jgi:predicted PurR-regulated permease PerM
MGRALPDLFVAPRSAGRRASDGRRESHDVRVLVRDMLVVAAVIGGFWLVYELGGLLLLLFFSVLFAYLLFPLVAFVQRRLRRGHREGSRALAITVVYVVLFGGLALWLTWVTPHLSDAVRQLPGRIQAFEGKGNSPGGLQMHLRIPGLSGAAVDQILSTLVGTLEGGARRIASAVVSAASNIPWLILVPILGFFLLKDGQMLTEQFVEVLPQRWRAGAPALLDRVDEALSAFIRAQLLACLIVGGMVFAGFALLGVPFAPILAVVAGIAEFVPLVGPLVVAIASAVVAAFQSPMSAVWVLLFLGSLRILEDYAIYPRLIGSSVHLHPLGVILAVLVGGELGGAVGVLLAIPVLAIALAVYHHLRIQP